MGAQPSLIKSLLPRSLLGRSILIIVVPLILLQVVSALIFFQSHWDKVMLRLARNLAGDIAAVITLSRQDPSGRQAVFDAAEEHLEMTVRLREGEILPNEAQIHEDQIADVLALALTEYVGRPFQIDSRSLDRQVQVSIQLTEGVLDVVANRKRLFSSTTYVFVLWMVGTSLILFGVAVIFMRNQVRPIRRLAQAAENFGKGRDSPHFKPEGAREVRQAAAAFLAMRDRLQRQIAQRTEMLAGVSHDLRTPLTRMRLELALLGDQKAVRDLRGDLDEMERMLEGYLAFARGEGSETPRPTNLNAILEEVVAQARRKNGAAIDLHAEGDIVLPLRPSAFRRCVTNLVENAARYGEHVAIRVGRRGAAVEITIDDDGPGIPSEKREEVFRPFARLDASRNPGTGGVGLGLTIARDLARSHGGDVELEDSPTGGLRARVRLPQ